MYYQHVNCLVNTWVLHRFSAKMSTCIKDFPAETRCDQLISFWYLSHKQADSSDEHGHLRSNTRASSSHTGKEVTQVKDRVKI